MYLQRMRDYMLVDYTEDLILIGYTNYYFQANRHSKSSTSEWLLGGEAISW